MVRFKGRSAQTYRIKNRPVNQGCELFALADSGTGYVHYFTPEGRISGTKGGYEFDSANSDG